MCVCVFALRPCSCIMAALSAMLNVSTDVKPVRQSLAKAELINNP